MHPDSTGNTIPSRYIVITPARDEEQYLEKTLESMVQQTIRPVQWIIVNDGSTDRTGAILDEWAAKYTWIRTVHRYEGRNSDADTGPRSVPKRYRGLRARHAKEIEAFYAGYAALGEVDWDFIAKVDADVSFAADYFATCFKHFAREPRLGIGGGVICHWLDGALKSEETPEFHVRGATKIYRRDCWDRIGGVVRGPGWDTLDEAKANLLGWKSRTFNELTVVHHRYTGTANGSWQNAVKNGVWSYVAGYHPLYMAARCCRQLTYRPYITGSFGLLYGFLAAGLSGIPKSADGPTLKYLREQQLRRLTFRSSIWK